MKKIYFIIAFCVVLFGAANVFLINKINAIKSENKASLSAYSQNELNLKASQEDLIKTILNYEKIDGKEFKDLKLTLRNPNEELAKNKKVFLQTTMSKIVDRKKVVFRFFQVSCSSCVTEQLSLLDVLGKKIGRDKILLLTDKLNDEISFFLLSRKLNFDIYEVDNQDTGIDFDKETIPYLCIIDSSGNLHSATILSPQSKVYSNSFYDNLAKKI